MVALVAGDATATGTCCSAARRTRSARSGTASATGPTRRRRSSASTRRIRSASWTRAARPRVATGRRSTRRSGCSSRGTGASPTLLNEVRARVRTGVAAPDEIVDVRGTLDAHAPGQGRARDRADAPRRRRSRAARTGARWSARAGLVRVPGRGRAAARVPAPRRAVGRVSVDRRARARTRACCTIATTTGR